MSAGAAVRRAPLAEAAESGPLRDRAGGDRTGTAPVPSTVTCSPFDSALSELCCVVLTRAVGGAVTFSVEPDAVVSVRVSPETPVIVPTTALPERAPPNPARPPDWAPYWRDVADPDARDVRLVPSDQDAADEADTECDEDRESGEQECPESAGRAGAANGGHGGSFLGFRRSGAPGWVAWWPHGARGTHRRTRDGEGDAQREGDAHEHKDGSCSVDRELGSDDGDEHAEDAAAERQGPGLHEELRGDGPSRGADGLPDPDLPGPFRHRHQHDVRHADAADQQADRGDGSEEHREALGALLPRLQQRCGTGDGEGTVGRGGTDQLIELDLHLPLGGGDVRGDRAETSRPDTAP